MLESAMQKQPNYPQSELAARLRSAMEDVDLSQADLARACGVKIQSVHDWRITGRIGKQHLITICRLTKKSLEYFLVGLGRAATAILLTLSILFHPQPAEAAHFSRFDITKICIVCIRVCRAWLARVLKPGFIF